jgi:hypothetical protein
MMKMSAGGEGGGGRVYARVDKREWATEGEGGKWLWGMERSDGKKNKGLKKRAYR